MNTDFHGFCFSRHRFCTGEARATQIKIVRPSGLPSSNRERPDGARIALNFPCFDRCKSVKSVALFGTIGGGWATQIIRHCPANSPVRIASNLLCHYQGPGCGI